MTIALAPASLPSAATGGSYSRTITASGGTAPYTFAVVSGVLPTGLALNSSTGVLSGTPTTIGTYSFTVRGTDSLAAFGDQLYTIVIASLALVPTSLPNGGVGNVYSQTTTASGGAAPYAYSISAGALPTGWALNSSTGVISGTTTVFGPFSFTVTATDANGSTVSQAYTITIAGVLYWFICSTSAITPSVPPPNSPDFNRHVANAIQSLSRPNHQVGHLLARPTSSSLNGHLLCDGSAISRTEFAQLFAEIGTTWGVGDGTTTFNLPNLVVAEIPNATSPPAQTITSSTVSTGGVVTAPSTPAETGGTKGGNYSSGGHTYPIP